MTIRIKPSRSSKRVIVGITQDIHNHRQGIENGLYKIGELLGGRIAALINKPPKTGRVYRIRGRNHQASAPGEAPANQTGKLVRSYNYNVHGPFQMEIGESVPYAGFLEEGTRRMKPRPHVLRAINETQGDAVNLFYSEVAKARRG